MHTLIFHIKICYKYSIKNVVKTYFSFADPPKRSLPSTSEMIRISKYYSHAFWKLLGRFKCKYLTLLIVSLFSLDYFGVFTHIFEISYDDSFTYPYDGNIPNLITALRQNKVPDVPPINSYNFTFIHNPKDKCVLKGQQTLRLVILVKSALGHFDRRVAIRSSWGFENRFFDVPSKTVFLVGVHPWDQDGQEKINAESAKYNDIVQSEFVDTYYNNTYKTMSGFRWAVETCSNSKFYLFVDDDMYVSVKNVLRFVRNPANYPDYMQNFESLVKSKREVKDDDKNLNETQDVLVRKKRSMFDFDLPDDVRLFAGFVFVSAPHRHRTSKWYVSLEEYPYHLWPPYVTAGAYIVSKEALLDMYYTSFYTKHFRFDDIYLGLIAKKAEIEPFHCDEFHFYKKDYTRYNYKYVITSHGYGDPQELLQVWQEQKSLGNA